MAHFITHANARLQMHVRCLEHVIEPCRMTLVESGELQGQGVELLIVLSADNTTRRPQKQSQQSSMVFYSGACHSTTVLDLNTRSNAPNKLRSY
jgi:hypothetical protein